MRKTEEKLFCDCCQKEIKDRTPSGSASIQDKDYCPECLTKLHREVDEEYHRVIKGEVPARRGGYRKLGDFADT